jgi:hypothetical protein
VTRDITAGVSAEVVKDRLKAAWIVYFNFDSGALRLWSGTGDLIWNGNTYTGTGTLGRISPIEETSDVRSNGIQLTLSGISSSLISIALGTQYQGRTCTVWLGFFNSSDVLIDDPVQVFSGKMDVMSIQDTGGTCEITVTAENRLVDLERPKEVRYYTDADQQRLSAGDKGCQFVETLQTKEIVWGRVRSSPPAASPPPSAAAPPASVNENNSITDEFGNNIFSPAGPAQQDSNFGV